MLSTHDEPLSVVATSVNPASSLMTAIATPGRRGRCARRLIPSPRRGEFLGRFRLRDPAMMSSAYNKKNSAANVLH